LAMREAIETVLLNPASAFTAAVAATAMYRTSTPVSFLVNPWELNLLWWLLGYAFVRVSLLGLVDAFAMRIALLLPPLPSRTGPKSVFQHKINSTDVTYLVINSGIEYIFALQISYLMWHAGFIARAPGSVGLLNCPVAFWLLLVVDDMLYAPLHRFMHLQSVYRFVHKHHHRNTFPARGYIDAANEHPVEQIAALTLHWIAVHVVAHTSGLHVGAIGAHFGFKALGACFNHTGYDLQLRFLGIDYSVRAHEMHHRKPQTNFAQYVMFWDRVMGTYKPYESGRRPQPPGAGEADAASELEPQDEPEPHADRLPAWACPATEASTGRVVES